MSQGELFDSRPFDEERVEAFGERPALTPEEYEAVTTQPCYWHTREPQLFDTGMNNYERMIGHAVLSGEITAESGYDALQAYAQGE